MPQTGAVTFLFTDIEGSTRLWEQDPERMSAALAGHDALARAAVEGHRGTVVKMTGDGMCAAFGDPVDALNATLALQRALADRATTNDVPLRVRCGLHAGIVEHRDSDFFGPPVNRAARIMGAAHGGQVLLSQAVVDCVLTALPPAVSLRDLGKVRLRDLARPEHVYQLAHPDLRQNFPALRSLEATPNNLPQQVTSFVGRVREMAEVKQWLGNTRLLTLLVVGGIGKKRLSLQVAVEVVDEYADGVWFVELAPVADARQVVQAVASVLGVKEEPGRPLVEVLVTQVQDRQQLLLLDNCEHLVSACAELVNVLFQAAPQLRVLATSREPLHVVGETNYQVPPLSVPDPSMKQGPGVLTESEAMHLFIERARAVQPRFVPTHQNAEQVAAICQRLDGIPLALELAAARMRALAVAEIAARLSDRFRLLTGGAETVLPRQQTLRACIDWSYELLSGTERALLSRLSVFAGGFTLAAAEAVGAGREIEHAHVFDLLAQLVDKSLVEIDAGTGRYRLLETVRQYAQERLNEAGDGEEVRARHVDFFLALAEETAPDLVGPEPAQSLMRLADERENLLLAHRHCANGADGAEKGLRLAHALTHLWHANGRMELGFSMTVEALTCAGSAASERLRGKVLGDAAYLSCLLGRYAETTAYAQEKLAIARTAADAKGASVAHYWLGAASMAEGDRPAARRHLEDAVALSRELGHGGSLAGALSGLADVIRADGELDTARSLYREALELFREAGERSSVAITLINLAIVAIASADHARARELLREAATITAEIRSKRVEQLVLEILAQLWASVGEWARATHLDAAAAARLAEMGLRRSPVDEQSRAQMMAKARNALGEAGFATAQSSGRAASFEETLADAHAWLETPVQSGDPLGIGA